MSQRTLYLPANYDRLLPLAAGVILFCMKRGLTAFWVVTLLTVVSCAPLVCPAQEKTDMEMPAQRLAKAITKAKITSVAVSDFAKSDGTPSPEGHCLAQEFAEAIRRNKHIAVADPAKVMPILVNTGVSAPAIDTNDSLEKFRSALGTEALVTGVLEIEHDHYTVKVMVRNLKDTAVIAVDEQTVKRPSYTDTLLALDPTGNATRVARPGQDGVSVPQCVECPGPNFTAEQRKANPHAMIVLDVVVGVEGRPTGATLVSAPDKSLAVTAIEAVKKWRFQPAADKNGKPVAVIVPVHIALRVD
jgi:TonB family protein